ncbi:hypothetical protein EI94DRAFT_1808676 [Lactarius quietus]|nr:hypothetical protein EI94DRAFT_1808676 [Lactarius quietus]
MTEVMKDIIMKIMVKVLGIFAIVMKEMKQGQAKKYLRKLIGRRDIEDALGRLDRLMQEEAQMATAQVLKVTHHVEDGVKTVTKGVRQVDDKIKGIGDKVKDVDNKVNLAIEGFTPKELTQPISSVIIQDILALREAELATMVYFYFDFRDTNKQNLHGALLSLLTQLSTCSDHCCNILSHVFKVHDDGTHKPSTSTMIACLKEMLKLLDQVPVYIILDKLDKCPNMSGIPSAHKQVLNL